MLKNYPHLSALALSYVLVTILFLLLGTEVFHRLVEPLGIGGIFVAGMMYTYSFTASIAAFLLPSFVPDYSPAFIAIVGGLGATLVDATLLKFIRGNLKAEMKRLGKIRPIAFLTTTIPFMRKSWFRNTLGFVVLALPLPDEIAVALMANTKISERNFRLISFCVNTLGIYALVSLVYTLS